MYNFQAQEVEGCSRKKLQQLLHWVVGKCKLIKKYIYLTEYKKKIAKKEVKYIKKWKIFSYTHSLNDDLLE